VAEDRGMANTEGDIAAFLRGMRLGPALERRVRPFVGIDECFNRREIVKLARELLRRNLIDSSGPLWYETREREGVIVGSFPGGVDKDSAFRRPNPLIGDIGVPVKHRSWSDYRVAQMLVVNFLSYDRLVLLSENIRNDHNGLRTILKEFVAPTLKARPDGLSLTALFKGGKTRIEDYISKATDFFEQGQYRPGYVEMLL